MCNRIIHTYIFLYILLNVNLTVGVVSFSNLAAFGSPTGLLLPAGDDCKFVSEILL